MIKVLVTGANGQLGRCIQLAAKNFPQLHFHFVSRLELDITEKEAVSEIFRKYNFDSCINAAAYTNVEQAESENDEAFSINSTGVKLLSEACKKHNIVLLHVSTDYVFDGTKGTSYSEQDKTNAINVYGASKLAGEEYITEICERYFIFRTSWLYSQFGHNFLRTILKKALEGAALTITTEQTGTPTNANDLAQVLLEIIASESENYGLYHYSNKGEATWYDFAVEILKASRQINLVKLAKTDHYRTFAKRPEYSVLNTKKFERIFNIPLIGWKQSLSDMINNRNVII